MRFSAGSPPHIVIAVTSGLPGGCARFDHYTVERTGTTITIAVWNTMPTGAVACTAIYGYIDHTIDLEPGLPSGSYTVHANEATAVFTVL